MSLTTNAGTTVLTLRLAGTGDVTIDWGDSSSDTYTLTGTTTDYTHTYSTAGEYTFGFTAGASNITRWDRGSENYGGSFPSLANLTRLDLHGNNTVSDVSALTSLTLLVLRGSNTVSDVSALTSLTSLDLQGNNTVSDVSALTSLTSLDLWGSNTVSDVSALTNLTSLDLLGNNTVSDVSALTSLTFLGLHGNNTVSDVSALTSLTRLNLLGNNTVSDVSALTSLTSLVLIGNNTVSINTVSPEIRFLRISNASKESVDNAIKAAWLHRNTAPTGSATREYDFRFGTVSSPTDTMRSLADSLEAGDLGSVTTILRTTGTPAETNDALAYNELVTIQPLTGFFPTGHAPSDAAIAIASTQLSAGPEPTYTSGALTLNADLTTTDTTVFNSQSNGAIAKTITLQEFIASQWEEVAPEDDYVIGRDYRATVSAANDGGTDPDESHVSNVVTYAGPATTRPTTRPAIYHRLYHSLTS
jgi:Leucine-rich repeat (LRR) protein